MLRLIQNVFDALIEKRLYDDGGLVIGNLLLEMRRDILDQTDISKEWIKEKYRTGHPPVEDIGEYVKRRSSKSKQ